MTEFVLVLDNIRSIYNVGAIFRTADAAGISKIYLTGITPYPAMEKDERKPWVAESVTEKIHKTALGAEEFVAWEYFSNTVDLIIQLKKDGFFIISLEQTAKAKDIFDWEIPIEIEKIALIVGNEVDGVNKDLLDHSDEILQIPMRGKKESLNVAAATAVAVYELINLIQMPHQERDQFDLPV